jgi:DNA-binding XRE family transcriptional regulator
MAVLLGDAANTAVAIRSDERRCFATLGERIARLRKARDITQRQLSEVMGVSLQVLFGVEHAKVARGKRGPGPQWLR